MTDPDETIALIPDELDVEAPEADAVEQATPVNPAERAAELRVGLEVDEADALEQSRVVSLDEDDYR